MLKYGKNKKINIDNLHPLNIDRQTLSLVPKNSEVLDIGCATGFMGEYLKREKKCKVTGIESRIDEAKEAVKKLDKVLTIDVEKEGSLRKNGKYDVVLASSVVEHLKNPAKALRIWRKNLKNKGFLIVTTSNIAHWSIRFKILRGKFDYEDFGILDRFHLHFYTIKSFKKLIENSGYKIEIFSIDPVGGGLPKISNFLSKFFPNLFAYQMLIMARPISNE